VGGYGGDVPAEFTFAPLTPAAFLDRAAAVFAGRTAVVDGDVRLTYASLAERCARLVSALARWGIGEGDRVAALCANSHVMLELHHAVPMRGAALVSINIRLAPGEMRYILEHSGAKLLVATREFADAAATLAKEAGIELVVEGEEYDGWLADGAGPADRRGVDERSLLAINYTSGTTGRPKGVMYHHRGAALQATAMAYHARLGPEARYLWTLPMFHCNGWCFTWAVTAAGGTHVCLRSVDTAEIWRLLRAEGITHFSAAPTVLTMIGEDPAAAPLDRRVHVDTGGAPPSPALLARLDPLGLDVTHLYGLTETFGPIAVNEWQPEWDELDGDACSRLRARQGVGNLIAQPLRVLDDQGNDVPADGETIGELAARGNDVMLGYYRDDEATAAVTRAGHFLTGDLAVMHPDGYVEIRDRSKDVIISGGENIASVEVEQVLDSHPAIVESAVVAMPDETWGELPVAFVTVRSGHHLDEDELTAYLREQLAHFKVPRRYVIGDLPRTSTGKIRKNVLRERAREGSSGSSGSSG
jgi:fatty-acyl-CoA synthase